MTRLLSSLLLLSFAIASIQFMSGLTLVAKAQEPCGLVPLPPTGEATTIDQSEQALAIARETLLQALGYSGSGVYISDLAEWPRPIKTQQNAIALAVADLGKTLKVAPLFNHLTVVPHRDDPIIGALQTNHPNIENDFAFIVDAIDAVAKPLVSKNPTRQVVRLVWIRKGSNPYFNRLSAQLPEELSAEGWIPIEGVAQAYIPLTNAALQTNTSSSSGQSGVRSVSKGQVVLLAGEQHLSGPRFRRNISLRIDPQGPSEALFLVVSYEQVL